MYVLKITAPGSLCKMAVFPIEQLRKHMLLFMTAVQAGTHGRPMPGHRSTLLYNYTVILEKQQMRCVTFLKFTELRYL